MPTASMRPAMAPLDDALLQESDRRLFALAIVSRVTDANHPALARAGSSDHAWLRDLASQVAQRLAEADPDGYAFLRPPPSHLPPPIEDEDQ